MEKATYKAEWIKMGIVISTMVGLFLAGMLLHPFVLMPSLPKLLILSSFFIFAWLNLSNSHMPKGT